MLKGDFQEGQRRFLRLRQSFFRLMRLRSVQSCHDAFSFRSYIQQSPPHFLLDTAHSDRWWNVGPIGTLAGISEVRRYAHPISLRENTHAECEAGKELLFV